jgi:hypothetical protein
VKTRAVVYGLLGLLLAITPASAQMYTGPGGYVPGNSTRATYVASVSGQATTAAILLSIEPPASQGFRLVRVCVGTSTATAASVFTVTIQRRTTASSGGTQLTNEGTGTTVVSSMDTTDANFPGIARLNGTPGTAGAVLDQWGDQTGVVGTVGFSQLCVDYGVRGEKPIIVPAGVTNGVSINVSTVGAGGLADGTISAVVMMN